MINDSWLRYNKNQKYAFIDSETCHVNLIWEENKPWQWSWLIGTRDSILEEHNYYVKWENLKVSKRAAAMTGFNQSIIDNKGTDPKEVLEKLDTIIYDPQYKLIMHNGLNFDVYLHNIHRIACGKSTDYSYMNRLYDSNYLAKGYKIGIQPRPGENLLAYQYKLCSLHKKGIKTSIETLCKDFEIPYSENAHDGLADVRMLHPIWKKLLQQVEI